MIKNTSSKIFRERYLLPLPEDFQWQETPIQIYPFELISKFIIYPTPILKSDYYYVIYIKQGEYRQQIANDVCTIKGPAILFAPEGTVYAIQEIGEAITGFFIQIEGKTISSIVSKGEMPILLATETVIRLNENDDQWLSSICKLLYNEMSTTDPNRKIAIGLLQALLHKIMDLSPGRKNISRQREIAIEFKQLVNKNFSEHKSVSFYAETMNISENYLNRCVKSEYNRNCKWIILETAIYQSQLLMFESSSDVSEISYQAGFESPSHFSRVFKRITGRTPTTFREQIMHGLS